MRPFFCELLARDGSGASWLPELLRLAPRARQVEPRKPLDQPGQLQPESIAPKRVAGVLLPGCFEVSSAPPTEFLAWLLANPAELTWPVKRKGVRRTFGRRAQPKREAWFDGETGRQRELIVEACAELKSYGADRSRGRWWAFEGFTSIDCFLQTDRLTLLVEGKRTERLSRSTAWFPKRNQLVRNLEVAAQSPNSHPAYVLLITEPNGADLTDQHIHEGAPHLDEKGCARLMSRYLGRCTWGELCEELDVGPLPETSDEAKAADACGSVLRY